ncbi:putative protein phosphatase 2C 1 [Zostera marina]|uniref:Protein phosphatase n=1 Tax=Zostera marina TaxID=29655 RepID=A0A0K9PSC6_ZOSMR|nr:putative protein phosphatase 2C 1 [Zostera marina]
MEIIAMAIPRNFGIRVLETTSTSWISPSKFTWNPSRKRGMIKMAQTEASPDVIKELSLSTGTYLIPHPKKVETGGEDAFFVGGCNGSVVAIADGVSGWAERNVNPALFSRELMRNVSLVIEEEQANFDPVILLKKAHSSTTSMGSATVIIAMLERNGVLKIASVGDCGLRVIRAGQLVFTTTPREHYFDCPFQVSSEANGQTYRDATVCSVQLMEGDAIILGSDGLFDNAFDREIVSTISDIKDAAEAAKLVANLAHNHSKDVNFDSPYTQEARTMGYDVPDWKKMIGKKLKGGKLDDITVIVGIVSANSRSSSDNTLKLDT